MKKGLGAYDQRQMQDTPFWWHHRELLGLKWLMKLHLQKDLYLCKACWCTGPSMEVLERAATVFRTQW